VDHLKGLPRNTQRDEKIAAMTKLADEMEASLHDIVDEFDEEEQAVTVAPPPTPKVRKRRTMGSPAKDSE